MSGNIANYRINLVKKIGIEKVEAIENYNEIVKFSIEGMKNLEAKYKRKLKELSV